MQPNNGTTLHIGRAILLLFPWVAMSKCRRRKESTPSFVHSLGLQQQSPFPSLSYFELPLQQRPDSNNEFAALTLYRLSTYQRANVALVVPGGNEDTMTKKDCCCCCHFPGLSEARTRPTEGQNPDLAAAALRWSLKDGTKNVKPTFMVKLA
jgi:hypothetical protein